jgi:hypothetical protein
MALVKNELIYKIYSKEELKRTDSEFIDLQEKSDDTMGKKINEITLKRNFISVFKRLINLIK